MAQKPNQPKGRRSNRGGKFMFIKASSGAAMSVDLSSLGVTTYRGPGAENCATKRSVMIDGEQQIILGNTRHGGKLHLTSAEFEAMIASEAADRGWSSSNAA